MSPGCLGQLHRAELLAAVGGGSCLHPSASSSSFLSRETGAAAAGLLLVSVPNHPTVSHLVLTHHKLRYGVNPFFSGVTMSALPWAEPAADYLSSPNPSAFTSSLL